MKELLMTASALAAYSVAVGIFFRNKVSYIKKKTDQEIYEREVEVGSFTTGEIEALTKKIVTIPSQFGYDIIGWLFKTSTKKKFIIICHGVTVNKINSIKYMKLFAKRGWNVFIYDHRRHGETGGNTTSYGYYEKFDLKAVVDWIKAEYGTDITLGIHGESMGAATMLLYAGMVEDGADFYIADCPYSSFDDQLRYRLKAEFKLPAFLVLPFANLILKLKEGYSIKDVSPISYIDQIQNPILFIHSAEDDYILPQMTKDLFAKKAGPKKLFIAPKGGHAYAYGENREEYEQAIDDFLEDRN